MKFWNQGSRNKQIRLPMLGPLLLLHIIYVIFLLGIVTPQVASKINIIKSWNFLEVFHKVPDVDKWFYNPIKYGRTDVSRCQQCYFRISNSLSDSNDNDFLLTLMMKSMKGFIPLIRVLYTIRTKANKFFFIDKRTIESMGKYEKDASTNCGATIVNLGQVRLPRHHAFYPFFRWTVYFDFLYSLRHPIYRIIVYDGQDTIFQGDPFFKGFNPDNLYITVEDRLIKSSSWARSTYKEYFENFSNNSREWNSSMINAGIIAGGYEPILRLMYIFLKNIDVSNIYSIKGVDQAILTKLIINGAVDETSYKIRFLTINDEFASISVGCWGESCIKYYPKKKFRIGKYKSMTRNITTLIVHQFDRYPLFTRTYLKACPRGRASSSNYIRGMFDKHTITYVEALIAKGLVH